MSLKIFEYGQEFPLESGKKLPNIQIAYHTYGELNADKSNVIWVCHALTANSDVFDWWPGLFGEEELFNDKEYFIVCANVLGSHYGSTNPLSINPETAEPYYLDFPQFTIRDIIHGHDLLAAHLGITEINTLIGGSLGGQQVLEWAASKTIKIHNLIAIGTNAFFSPWGIAFNESQRLALTADPSFYEKRPDAGLNGLKAARSMALISYRTYNAYGVTQVESDHDKTDQYKASSYQSYQGDKLVKRFNALSYWYLTKAMDSHHLGRSRGAVEEVLHGIQGINTLVIGIPSDVLFPPQEQEFIAKNIPNAEYYELHSFFGHDGFLIETKTLTQVIGNFLAKYNSKAEQLNLIQENE
ncbi:UNVERIFIED_CONTAM: metX [Trichonephila clavipes]|uniref:Homoserine O-acetyltransferase n=1 Tax=Sphingobacterium tenebrionis TaxID=3111775 RepID=A0ABU8I2J4_9SPHI|nr:homoserine O-acetyltransferase [Sphingobacterium sp. CZ-2]QBR11797.1 homoserine O-acetyltransferase [Sphingobacterium sp. CZ-2]